MKRWTTKERETANLVRISNRKVNEFRDAANNTDFHEVAKLLVYRELRAMNHNLIVEAIFENESGRVDILDLTTATAYEIAHTETDKQFLAKNYPVDKILLNAKDVIDKRLNKS